MRIGLLERRSEAPTRRDEEVAAPVDEIARWLNAMLQQLEEGMPSPIVRNEALLQRTLDYVTDHPEEHLQRVWAFRQPDGRVIGCVAYHAVRLAGHQVQFSPSGFAQTASGASIRETARQALGLTYMESAQLFNPTRSISQMWQIAGELTNGRVARANGKAI